MIAEWYLAIEQGLQRPAVYEEAKHERCFMRPPALPCKETRGMHTPILVLVGDCDAH